MVQPQTKEGERIEYAPTAGDFCALPGVVSVVLGDDEEVRWHWTHYPGGGSVVTGYEIVKKDQGADEDGFSFEKAVADWLWPEKNNRAQDAQHARTASGSHNPVGFLHPTSVRAG